MCYRWALAKIGSPKREQMSPLEEEVDNTRDYNTWYAQKRVVDTRERVRRCKVCEIETNASPSRKGLVLPTRNKS
jgi:hypothetical protein